VFLIAAIYDLCAFFWTECFTDLDKLTFYIWLFGNGYKPYFFLTKQPNLMEKKLLATILGKSNPQTINLPQKWSKMTQKLANCCNGDQKRPQN